MSATLENQPIDQHTAEFLHEAHAAKFDFHSLSVKSAGDERLKTAVTTATMKQYTGRQLKLMELPDSDKLRTLAGEIKQHTLDNLDYYLV
jgi:L-lactate dehydrogenase complex protein LldF